MAKLKRKLVKMRVEEESSMSGDALRKKIADLLDMQYRRNLNKLKGAQLCLWSKTGDSSYKIKFYRSYRDDMCDHILDFHIEDGMERCAVFGLIKKPAAIWAMFWGVIASVLIDFLIISYCILFVGGFDLMNGLMISFCVSLVRVYICVGLITIDRECARSLRSELLGVIRDKPLPGDGDEDETAVFSDRVTVPDGEEEPMINLDTLRKYADKDESGEGTQEEGTQ